MASKKRERALKDLKQETERLQDELQIQQRELEQISEREGLEEELLPAKSGQKILQEECFDPRDKEVIDRSPWELPARSETSDPSAPLSPSIHKESAVHLENKARLHTSEAALRSEDYLSSARKETLTESRNELPSRRNRVSFPTHLDVDTPTISETDIPRAQATAYGDPDPRLVVSGEPFLPKVTTSSSLATQINTGSPLSSIYVPGAPEILPSHAYSNTMCDPLFQQMQKECSDIQRKQVEILRRMAIPIPKPPIFSGNILDYPKWEIAFDALIDEEAVNPSHKLYYLGEYTSGPAAKMISGLLGLRTDDAYKRARKILKERYGEAFKIYEAYREKLLSWPVCHTKEELQEYVDFLVMTKETMRTVKYLNELDSFSAMREIAARFPARYVNKWRQSAKKVEKEKGRYTFEDLVEFAQEASADANHPVFSFDALSSIRKGLEKDTSHKPSTKQIHPNPDRRRARSVALATNSNDARKPNPSQSAPEERKCALCAGSHDLERCNEFLQKSVDEREHVCKQRGVCYSCLRRGHRVRECQRKGQCNVCKKTHATLLHQPHTQEKREGENREQATSNCMSACLTSECNGTTTSMILPIWLYHRSKPEAAVQVYSVLDDQSDTCFITEETRKTLGLEGPEIPLELGTMHSLETVSTQRLEGLLISSYDKGENI